MDKISVPKTNQEIHRPEFPLTPDQVPTRAPDGSGNLEKYFRESTSQFDFSMGFHRGSRSGGVGYQLVAWSFVAALIDALLLFATSCLFLLCFSFLVRSQFSSVLQVFGGSIYQIGLAGGVMLVGIYMIMLRVFLGFTIGEWACALRLGDLRQRLNRYYSLKVIARMVLIFATGLVLIPAFSLLLGRDLAGFIVRLPLVQVKR